MSAPRSFTQEEVLDQLYTKLHTIAHYWATNHKTVQLTPGINDTEEARAEGIVFTISRGTRRLRPSIARHQPTA